MHWRISVAQSFSPIELYIRHENPFNISETKAIITFFLQTRNGIIELNFPLVTSNTMETWYEAEILPILSVSCPSLNKYQEKAASVDKVLVNTLCLSAARSFLHLHFKRLFIHFFGMFKCAWLLKFFEPFQCREFSNSRIFLHVWHL